MPLLYSNFFSFLLYGLAILSINLLEVILIIRDLFFWKKGYLDTVKTYKKDWISIIVLTILLLFTVNMSFFVSGHFHTTQIKVTLWIPLAIGLFFIFIGLLLRVWCVKILGNFFRLLVVVQKNQIIIMKGPYHFIRHPSYSAGMLTLVGLGFCLTNWLSILICLLVPLIGYSIRIQVEEKIMVNHFGALYTQYQKNTYWKLIPYIF